MLRGTEICTKCEEAFSTALVWVEKTAKKGIVRIERTRDDVKAKIDEHMRSVIGGEDETEGGKNGEN
jgi:hypothetical protein